MNGILPLSFQISLSNGFLIPRLMKWSKGIGWVSKKRVAIGFNRIVTFKSINVKYILHIVKLELHL